MAGLMVSIFRGVKPRFTLLLRLRVCSLTTFLAVRISTTLRLYRSLLDMPEDKLFWRSMMLLFISGVLLMSIVVYWAVKGFEFISIEKQTLALVALASNGMLIVSNVITAHLLKRS